MKQNKFAATGTTTKSGSERLGNWLPKLFRSALAAAIATAASSSLAGQLTVYEGSGSGNYNEGETAYVLANPTELLDQNASTIEPLDASTPNRIFDRWVGQVEHLEDPLSSKTSFAMPAGNVVITAQYKDAPRWGTLPVLTFFPADPSRVIYIMHGSEGCATCIANNTSMISFIRDANSRGYAVVIPQSFDRNSKLWDNNPNASQNVDIQRLAAIQDDLINRNLLNNSTPVYLMGISGGGNFASLFDSETQSEVGFTVTAIALALSPGEGNEMPNLDVPTLIAMGENDTNVPYSAALSSFNNLISREIPTQLVTASAGALLPHSFWVISGIDSVESEGIFTALQQQGLLDDNNFLQENPRDSSWEPAIRTVLEDEKEIGQVRTLLMATYGEHAYIDAFSSPILEFFEAPNTVVNVIPNIHGFAPASAAVGEQVIISGDFFVDIQSVSIAGVEAQFFVTGTGELTAIVPDISGQGPITVANRAGTDVSDVFFGASAAEITDISVTEGPPGTTVQLGGVGLSGIQSVTFNGISATFSEFTPKAMATVVPAGASDGPLVVTTSSGSINAGHFDVYEAPVVTSISTNRGHAHDSITIYGDHLTSVMAVKLGQNTYTEYTITSDQELVFKVPTGVAGPQPVIFESTVGNIGAGWFYVR